MAVARRRVAQLSTTFRRSVIALGLQPGSAGFRAVFATAAALAKADELPGIGDDETRLRRCPWMTSLTASYRSAPNLTRR